MVKDHICITFDREIRKRIDEEADKIGISRSSLMEILVRDALNRFPGNISIKM